MTKVGLGFGDKTGSNCSKAVPIFVKQTVALCLNEAGHGFPNHLEVQMF